MEKGSHRNLKLCQGFKRRSSENGHDSSHRLGGALPQKHTGQPTFPLHDRTSTGEDHTTSLAELLQGRDQ